jgi:hypothetical protein
VELNPPFSPIQNRSSAAPEPTPIANLLAAGLTPPVDVELPVPINRRAKWVTPKGEKPKPVERPKTTEPRKPAVHKPRPQVRPDTDPEQWGQYYFRDAILDQLDVYFTYLKRMRHNDKEAYELHKRLGIQIMPQSAVQSFDLWRSTGDMNDLSTWWKQNRPAFGAVAYGINRSSLEQERIQTADLSPEDHDALKIPDDRYFERSHKIITLTGGFGTMVGPVSGVTAKVGRMWVPKFLYFHKYSKPPPEIQKVADGDVYLMTIYWDRLDHGSRTREKRWKGGIPQEYAICVERSTGEVRILRQLIIEHERKIAKTGFDKGHTYTLTHKRWGIKLDQLNWAHGRLDASPEEYLKRCFIEAALMYESATMGSMIRVHVTRGMRGSLSASFGVDIKRTAYFFKDRDVVLTEKGKKARIFHIRRPHMRKTKKGEIAVKLSFPGLRKFTWAGYRVAITVPGRDDALNLAEFNVGSYAFTDKELRKYKQGEIKSMAWLGSVLISMALGKSFEVASDIAERQTHS